MKHRFMLRVFLVIAFMIFGRTAPQARGERTVAELRLVPFPKEVKVCSGTFDLQRPLVVETSGDAADATIVLLRAELERSGLPVPKLARRETNAFVLQLYDGGGGQPPDISFRDNATPEDYRLIIQPDRVTCQGKGAAGLFYAVQTLRQLIRTERDGAKLPCLEIRDWPSLRWRCFQDDLTRGPSSTLQTLERGVELGAFLKLNLFTYYMEYQYAFQKHPDIGPKDGSLHPGELKAVVAAARRCHVQVLGNQQSFGHFGRILRHPQYAHLGENQNVLSPVKEETYQLLDDLYSEVCPLLPLDLFNVCCDETWGLGEGPSSDLAQQIGVGGVYVQHIRRIHDLLKAKYGKRMMMWGDIILNHPEKLDQIPADTIMLTWGYGPRESFEDQIIPFKDSGYEFFVCPGISNWSRILPDFGVAMTNIQHFVRDGAEHGAVGMLNTDWEDDGEALQGYRWHGHAWGAECAWNASTTRPGDFNRRIGAVLFGEPGDHFGRAIQLLLPTHRLPGMQGMMNRRFWEDDFRLHDHPEQVEESANQLLTLVRPAIEHLEACRCQATVNADLLDAFLLGARRMERIGARMLDSVQVARLYRKAAELPPRRALPLLEEIDRVIQNNRDAHEELGREFSRLWLRDCRPYALDWTMNRYAAAVERYDQLSNRMATIRRAAENGQPLPQLRSLLSGPAAAAARR